MKPKAYLRTVKRGLSNHSPAILTGIGISGMGIAIVMAVKATPKAYSLLKEAEEEKDEPLTKVEIVKAAGKCYIPTLIAAGASAACIIGANSINNKRNAALATAYTLLETSAREYQEKVLEEVGEKKEEEIRQSVNESKLAKNPASKAKVFNTGHGDTLCFDALTGRYFFSDVDELKRVQNDVNYVMLNEQGITLNEVYYMIGLDGVKLGDRLGWYVDRGLLDMKFTTQLSDDNRPCVVLDYSSGPFPY